MKDFEDYLVNYFSEEALIEWRNTKKNRFDIRTNYAIKYLLGSGYEIGAQTNPLIIPDKYKSQINISYIDRMSKQESCQIFNLDENALVEVDLVCEADNLFALANESVDFIVACHVIEHTVDLIHTIQEMLRVIKQGGVLFLVYPNNGLNKFDFFRVKTTWHHIMEDYQNKTKDRISIHQRESIRAKIATGVINNDFEEIFKFYKKSDYRCHMHVLNIEIINKLVDYINHNNIYRVKMMDVFHTEYSYEDIVILKKIARNSI